MTDEMRTLTPIEVIERAISKLKTPAHWVDEANALEAIEAALHALRQEAFNKAILRRLEGA